LCLQRNRRRAGITVIISISYGRPGRHKKTVQKKYQKFFMDQTLPMVYFVGYSEQLWPSALVMILKYGGGFAFAVSYAFLLINLNSPHFSFSMCLRAPKNLSVCSVKIDDHGLERSCYKCDIFQYEIVLITSCKKRITNLVADARLPSVTNEK
jgi:hypothetical protein